MMKTLWVRGLPVLLLALSSACDVESSDKTSGVADPKTGVIVVNGDYSSVTVSAVSQTGEVLSPVIISSGSRESGLSAALSGDVVLPGSDLQGKEVVLIDRSNAVLTWVDLETGSVRAQLDVSTGFASNPHDYVQVSDTKAYVLRFARNLDSGQAAFDDGNDLLEVDPSSPAIVGRIDLMPAMDGADPELLPAAERGVHIGGKVYVVLTGLAPDFSDVATARVAVVDAESSTLENTLVLDGMRNCTGIAPSPDRKSLAVACNGFFAQDPDDGFPDSGIVLLSLDGDLNETERITSDTFQYCDGGCRNVQVNGVAWVDDDTLFASTFGMHSGGPNGDISYPGLAFEVDLAERSATERASGDALDVGIPVCFPRACFLPDAGLDGGVLRVFDVDREGALAESDPIVVDTTTGLPPHHLQRY